MHGKACIDQRAVNGSELSEIFIFIGQNIKGLVLKSLINVGELFHAPSVDRFRKAALFDPLFGSDGIARKVIFFEDLKKVLSGGVFFQMEEDEGFKLIFKGHLQRSVPPCRQRRHPDHGHINGPIGFAKFAARTLIGMSSKKWL